MDARQDNGARIGDVPAHDIAIYAEHVSKVYSLGVLGRDTLRKEIQSRMALRRGEEDPNSIIGHENAREGIIRAVDDVSFTIRKGERVGFIGKNGAGKSTLLKLICRITSPSEGLIAYNGRVTSMLEVGTGFHPELTGRENIYMNGAILGMKRSEIDEVFDDIVAFSEMERFIDTPVKRYSSGMYVRLAFAVSAHLNADIVIMDEVLAVGDAAFQDKCITRMREIAEKQNKTIIYVSHHMDTVQALCNRCLVLDEGRVIFDGEPKEAEAVYRQHVFTSNIRQYTADIFDTGESAHITGVSTRQGDSVLDRIDTHIGWECLTDVSSMHLRIEIMTNKGNPVASKLFFDVISGAKGDCGEGDFSLDVSKLQNGDYTLVYVLFQTVGSNINSTINRVEGHEFHIRDPKREERLTWRSDWWGYFEL